VLDTQNYQFEYAKQAFKAKARPNLKFFHIVSMQLAQSNPGSANKSPKAIDPTSLTSPSVCGLVKTKNYPATRLPLERLPSYQILVPITSKKCQGNLPYRAGCSG